jgi:hypothetical protein
MEVATGLEIIDDIGKFIESQEFEFFEDSKTDIKLCYDLTTADIKLMINDAEIKSFDITIPKKCLYILAKNILDYGLTEKIAQFIANMLELISNWNNNLAHDLDISMLCRLMFFLLEVNKGLSKAIDILRIAADRNRMLREWLPPAFEISKDYLDVLLEKAEKLNNEGITADVVRNSRIYENKAGRNKKCQNYEK